jgi:murein DD-endopeptidase MepM/ murein hydrolase activator NlpD
MASEAAPTPRSYPPAMRARRIGRALRFAVPALAAASVAAAAGGYVAGLARADEPPCDEATGVARGETLPCDETVPPPTTVSTTVPVEEPPPETEPATPATPPPGVTTTTAPAEQPAPATATTSVPTPPTATSPDSSGGTFGSGTLAGPPHRGTPTLSGGPYVFPVLGRTSFDDTWGAPRATVGWHHGVDIFAPLGSPIVAVADGVLFSVGWNRIGGHRLWLRDREGNYFYYAHLSGFSPVALESARVRAGTVVGYVGNTGDAAGTPYHLHFEIHPLSLLSLGYDGAVDPFPYVSSWRRLDHALDDLPTGAGEAPASSAAPAAGAYLLGFTDISSASGLSAGSLEHTLEEAADAATVVYEPEQAEATTSLETIPLPREGDARIARSLDLEAVRHAPSVWDSLAACESGGDWGANTGNGYVGGLQFLAETWASHGGSAFAPAAHLATREQQIAVAERVLDSQGWRAWPACSAMLGLPALAND